MAEVRDITYTNWLSLIKGAMDKGRNCRELILLKSCYPISAGTSCESMIYNQLAELEAVLLKTAIYKFQKAMNQCLEEGDLEVAESAFIKFRNTMSDCLFFVGNEGYPDNAKQDLLLKIQKNVTAFQTEIEQFLRGRALEDGSRLIEELNYLVKKKKLTKIVLECRDNA